MTTKPTLNDVIAKIRVAQAARVEWQAEFEKSPNGSSDGRREAARKVKQHMLELGQSTPEGILDTLIMLVDEVERLQAIEQRLIASYHSAVKTKRFYESYKDETGVERYGNRLWFIGQMLGYTPAPTHTESETTS